MTHGVCHFFYEFRWTGQDWRTRRKMERTETMRLSRRGGVKMCGWKWGEDKWQMRHRKFHMSSRVCVCVHDEGKGWQTYDVIKWHVVYQASQQMGPVVEKCVCVWVGGWVSCTQGHLCFQKWCGTNWSKRLPGSSEAFTSWPSRLVCGWRFQVLCPSLWYDLFFLWSFLIRRVKDEEFKGHR